MTNTLLKRYRSIPLLLKIVVAIVMGVGAGLVMPVPVVRAFNTFNGLFDQLLKFLIPLIIVGLVTPAIAEVGRGAKRLLLITATLAYCATVVAGMVGYGAAAWVFPAILPDVRSLETITATVAPTYFSLEIPPVMGVMTALVMSFLVGLGIAVLDMPALKHGFGEFKAIVTMAIERLIIPLLPIYIFGLFLDMSAAGSVGMVLVAFAQVIAIILALTLMLLVLQYCIAGAVVRRNPFRLLWTMAPAYVTALGTSSSAATIPITLRQTIKNGVREGVAGFVVPLCATIHLSGSMLKIVSCAIAIMLMHGMSYDMPMMLGFILMLGVTMIAAPGVPGGAIMAAVGLLDTMLGFSPEQQAMMITLYIAMDSFGTACNVTGDGAIALIVDKMENYIVR